MPTLVIFNEHYTNNQTGYEEALIAHQTSESPEVQTLSLEKEDYDSVEALKKSIEVASSVNALKINLGIENRGRYIPLELIHAHCQDYRSLYQAFLAGEKLENNIFRSLKHAIGTFNKYMDEPCDEEKNQQAFDAIITEMRRYFGETTFYKVVEFTSHLNADIVSYLDMYNRESK